MSVSEILILKYAVWKRCQKTGSDTPATKMYMISNFLVLTLLSLGFADASIFDLSALRNKGDNDGITIRKTNNTVRPFGASPPTEAAHAPPVSVLIPESAAPQVAVMIPTYTIPYHSIPTPEQSLKRPRIENHIYEQDLEKYIQAEVAFNAFKKAEKRVALRRVIELIASNDLDGFMAYEGEFETAFGHGYHLFKRGVRKAEYMMHYIIRFGRLT